MRKQVFATILQIPFRRTNRIVFLSFFFLFLSEDFFSIRFHRFHHCGGPTRHHAYPGCSFVMQLEYSSCAWVRYASPIMFPRLFALSIAGLASPRQLPGEFTVANVPISISFQLTRSIILGRRSLLQSADADERHSRYAKEKTESQSIFAKIFICICIIQILFLVNIISFFFSQFLQYSKNVFL